MLAAAAAAAAVSATQHPATLDRILQDEDGGAQDFLPRRVWQPGPCARQTNCTVDSSFARHLAATWASSEDHTIISRAVDADPSRLCLCPPVPNASLVNESLPQQAGGTSSSMAAGDGRAPFFVPAPSSSTRVPAPSSARRRRRHFPTERSAKRTATRTNCSAAAGPSHQRTAAAGPGHHAP